jgi:hypothetical protein
VGGVEEDCGEIDVSACKSECDCDLTNGHAIDCHSRRLCDEGAYCDFHFEEAAAENAWMLGVPLSAITGQMSEADEQDLTDAGRGHLVRK